MFASVGCVGVTEEVTWAPAMSELAKSKIAMAEARMKINSLAAVVTETSRLNASLGRKADRREGRRRIAPAHAGGQTRYSALAERTCFGARPYASGAFPTRAAAMSFGT
jgi:hypothetical protein